MTDRRRARAALVGLGVLLAAACAPLPRETPVDDPGPFLGVAVGQPLTSYNPASLAAATAGDGSGVLGRVLPGFTVLGPEGLPVADTDVGTATRLAADPLAVRYTFSPEARFSDGVPMGCADLVLAWVARSGRYGAGAADTTGYADVAGVDCEAGGSSATVRFERPITGWRTLFGAGDLLPAHVAADRTGVTDVVAAAADDDTAALGRLTEFWATGWALPTGPVDADGSVVLDPALFPASGPYRLDRVAADRSTATLLANPAWWGDPPLVPRVVVHLDPAEPAPLLAGGAVVAAALPAGPQTADAVALATSPVGSLRVAGTASLQVEELVLDTRGVLGDPAARRALAACVPRAGVVDELVDPVAPGTAVLDSHVLLPGRLGYAALTGPAAPYGAVDPAAARDAAQASGLAGQTVRIGYRGPDERLARTVALTAESCGAAGIDVVDVGGPDVDPTALDAGTADAVVVARGGTTLPGSAAAGLRSTAPTNWGRYAQPRVDALLDELAVAPTLDAQLPLAAELEAILWTDLPTLPLHQVPTVTALVDRLPSAVPNPSSAGIAWNVDRWALT